VEERSANNHQSSVINPQSPLFFLFLRLSNQAMKKHYLILILIFSFWKTYGGIIPDRLHVLISVARNEQPDSLGYNMVSELSAVIYKGIINGQIKLWDSPKKTLAIMPNTLESIENSSHTLFASIENLYIHESWNIGKSDVKITTLGFEFVKKIPGKEDIQYGYVDYDDAMITLKSNFSEPNADGYWYVTFDQLLKSRQFKYSIYQFGNRIIKDLDESDSYMHSAFESKEYKPEMEEIKHNKLVTYTIEENHRLQGDAKLEKGNLFLNSMESFLNSNSWIYYNMIGVHLSDSMKHYPPVKLKISKVVINEIWNMNGTYITYQPQTIVLYANDSALRPITMDEIRRWDMMVDFKSVEEFLKEKPFFSIINKINNQAIDRFASYKYEKALLNADWRAINKYVKTEF
jgi:hypothetical protein